MAISMKKYVGIRNKSLETLINPNQINVGNESAIDLLLAMNKAKVDLSTNLEGKGIEANPFNETLNQLVNKVADISSDSSKELLNCIVTGASVDMDFTTERTYYNVIKFNGYIFWAGYGNNNLYYIKISDLDSTYNNSFTTLSSILHTVALGYTVNNSNYAYKLFSFSKDGTKLYIARGGASSSDNLIKCTLTWSDDEITSVTVDGVATVKDGGNTARNLKSISCNSDGSKILCCLSSNTTKVFVYDVANDTSTEITGLNSNSYDTIPMFLTDTDFVTVSFYSASGGDTFIFNHYSLNGTTATSLLNEPITITKPTIGTASYTFPQSIMSYEYDTNKFKVFFAIQRATNSNSDILVMYDSDTKTYTSYTSKYFGVKASSSYIVATDILETTNNYILFNSDFFVFDKSWNLVSDRSVNLTSISDTGTVTSSNVQNIVLSENKIISVKPNNNTCATAPLWINKKAVVRRTQSINGNTVEIDYPIINVTAQNVIDGYLD